MRTVRAAALLPLCALAWLPACGGKKASADSAYSVGGSLSGLAAGHLLVLANGADQLALSANGPFTFADRVADGQPYAVTVATASQFQPCTVAAGSGQVHGAAVTDVQVSCGAVQPPPGGPPAKLVIGQPNFSVIAADPNPTDRTVSNPLGNPVLQGNVLFLPDTSNDRLVAMAGVPTQNGAPFAFAVGEPDLNTDVPRTAVDGLFLPHGCSANGAGLAVADHNNHRVLLFTALPSAANPNADVVLGQPDFVTQVNDCSATNLYTPQAVQVVAGRVAVADSGNNRVLLWNAVPTTNAAPADVVLGQPNMQTCPRDPNALTVTASSMFFPTDVWTDGSRLVVVDQGLDRVLIWNSWPAANGAPADLVLGQASLTSARTRSSTPSRDAFAAPAAVTSDGTRLVVSDARNNRVLVWNTFPTANGALPDAVLGQANFNNAYTYANGTLLNEPQGLAIVAGQLLVADSGNNRYLLFDFP